LTAKSRNRRERKGRGENQALRSRRPLRFFLLASFVALAALFVFSVLRRTPIASLERIPNQNILLITIDTLRGDALHSYGGVAATPALDALAASGVRFDFAHAHAVVTLPSHASILTGTYPYTHGIRDNSGERADRRHAVEESRLRHRCLRRRVSVALALRTERRFRRLRRSLRRNPRAD
jgi:Type I phosphodiesterase / nucleotide pyrophosphatase